MSVERWKYVCGYDPEAVECELIVPHQINVHIAGLCPVHQLGWLPAWEWDDEGKRVTK